MDAHKIKKHRKVNHWFNLFMALSLAGFCTLIYGWCVGVAMLPLISLVFDQYLNWRRGLPINYQPMKPESVIDKAENALFGHKNAWLFSNLLYLKMFVILVVTCSKTSGIF